ncbi:MAG: hypothetical protein AAF391_08495 [Bacteroidota bacterium]
MNTELSNAEVEHPYIVVAHYQNQTPHSPKNAMEKELVEKLEKMGFKPYQIRIMFERLGAGKLILETENAFFATQVRHSVTPSDKFKQVLKERYRLQFKNDKQTNRMRGVKDLQKYVKYLEKNKIEWTYLNIYDGNSKIKIGSLYYDEPIPKRMIE